MSFDTSKLSPRLKELSQMIPESVQEIWDICCDHGYLGRYLLNQSQGKVVFLDQVTGIMQKLEQNLESEFPPKDFKIILADGRKHTYSIAQDQNCFCIAGVGSNTITAIVEQIENCLESQIHEQYLLIGSQKKNFELRAWFQAKGWKMVRERLVLENGNFRELWLLHLHQGEVISLVGKPEIDQTPLWLDFWKEEFMRMNQIQKKGGHPEIPPNLLESQIEKYSSQ